MSKEKKEYRVVVGEPRPAFEVPEEILHEELPPPENPPADDFHDFMESGEPFILDPNPPKEEEDTPKKKKAKPKKKKGKKKSKKKKSKKVVYYYYDDEDDSCMDRAMYFMYDTLVGWWRD